MDRALFEMLRFSHLRQPVTSTEGRKGLASEIIAERTSRNVRTQGEALVAGLAQACAPLGVQFLSMNHLSDCHSRRETCSGVETVSCVATARHGVVMCTGGFEWNPSLVATFLPGFSSAPTAPPGNDGDGLLLALEAGASVANMTEAWWTAAYCILVDVLDDRPLTRIMVRELALPGSIMVNRPWEAVRQRSQLLQ